jgi:hypothetical protein
MTAICESRPLVEAMPTAQPDGPSRLSLLVIDAGWGSSGYYSAEVLQQAAKDRVFPAGTHMYLDHPTESETWERPERSVKDLAAVLTEDARWDPAVNGLIAEARVFAPWRQTIADMAPEIGVSIRASAETDVGTAEGRSGRLVTELLEGYSVDFVTKAGRGGKIVSVHESKVEEARNVGQWLEARIHQSFTNLTDEMFGEGKLTREERISLSSAIGDALTAFVSGVEAKAPELYTRDLWDDPGVTPIEPVDETDEESPSRPAGQSEANESEEDTMAQVSIDESQYAALQESAGRAEAADKAVVEAQRERDEAKQALVESQKREDKAVAESIVKGADFEFNALESAGLVAQAPQKDGRLDAEAFRTFVTAEAAKRAEEAGAGKVRNGGTGQPVDTSEDLSESDLDRELAQLSGRTVKEA